MAPPQGAACDIGAVELVLPPGSAAPGPGGGATATPGGAGAGAQSMAAPDRTRPRARLSFARQTLAAALARGLATRVSTAQPAAAVVEVLVEGATARRVLGHKAQRVRVAHAGHGFAAAGARAVLVRFAKAAKTRLRALRQVRVLVRLTLTDRAGNQTSLSRHRTLRR